MPLLWLERLRNAGRLKQILGVAIRYGFDHVVEQVFHARRFRRRRGEPAPDPRLARLDDAARLRHMIEALGPTFIKIGQILSTRPDLLPDWAIRELRKLQDQVTPLEFEAVRQQIESELGGTLEQHFRTFASEPTAAASLGQVHRAELPDGTVVAVKVQRPGIEQIIRRDLSVLRHLAELGEGRLEFARGLRLPALVDELAASLRDELVYTIEGRNAERALATIQPEDRIVVPRVDWERTTARVLCCEMFEGQRVSELEQTPENEPLRRELALRLATYILRGMLLDGFFHADPHPGNLFLFDNGVTGLIDWGMVGVLARSTRESLAEIFLSLATQDVERLADEICHLGLAEDGADLERFRVDLARALDRYFHLSRDDFPLAQVLNTILTLSFEHNIQLPAEVPLLIKVLVTVEGTCMELDPQFELKKAFEPIVARLVGSRLEPEKVAREVAGYLRQLNRLAGDLPRQTEQILRRLESGRLVVRAENEAQVKALGALTTAFHRLGVCVLAAGTVIGAALLFPYHTPLGLTLLAVGAAATLVAVFLLLRAG